MKKFLLLIIVLTVGFSGLSYAVKEFNYESAKSLANDYIVNSSFDENWKDGNPHISGEGKYFYTDTTTPSYIEFKVSCDKTPDCGFVMVNFDGDDVSIPIASTSGNTPSEVLVAQNGGNIDDNKLYYFSPFEQYSEDEKTGEVASIDQDDIMENKSIIQDNNLSKDIKTKKLKEFKSKLKDKLSKSKDEAKDYKKSDDFKTKRKELKDKKQTIPKEEYSYKILPLANANTSTGTSGGYTAPTASNILVSGTTSTSCSGRVPCYQQFDTAYNGSTCKVGCVPIAYSMIYGYYDKNGIYPDLISGVAPEINSTIIDALAKNIGQNYVSTYCSGATGLTSQLNRLKGIQYAKDMGYSNSSVIRSVGTVSALFTTIKSAINAGNPIIANTSNHSMVAFGYNSTSGLPIIRMNIGRGNNTLVGNDGKTYNYSNIDYNMNSIYFGGANQGAITSIIKVTISK